MWPFAEYRLQGIEYKACMKINSIVITLRIECSLSCLRSIKLYLHDKKLTKCIIGEWYYKQETITLLKPNLLFGEVI
jgi:hypothetical protein